MRQLSLATTRKGDGMLLAATLSAAAKQATLLAY